MEIFVVKKFLNFSVMQKFKQQVDKISPQKVEKSVLFLYVYNMHQQAPCVSTSTKLYEH